MFIILGLETKHFEAVGADILANDAICLIGSKGMHGIQTDTVQADRELPS